MKEEQEGEQEGEEEQEEEPFALPSGSGSGSGSGSYTAGPFQSLPWADYQKLCASDSYMSTIAPTIQRQRCDDDILYAILSCDVELLDRVLGACYAMLAKQYAPQLERSRVYREAHAFLTTPAKRADAYVKTFQFLFVLCKEARVQELVTQAYDGAQRDAGPARLKRFLPILGGMVDSTLNWPCSEMNITGVVRDMVHAARKEYSYH
jgi:hypothetical protein